MKEKIFYALKQSYSSLGLGDSVLMALAATLDATDIVTDENLADIVSKQSTALEAIQKSNDKRAADAAAKAKRDADKALADKLAAEQAAEKQKAEEEAARQKAQQDAQKALEDEGKTIPAWFQAQQEAFEKRMQEANARYEEQQKLLQSVKEENDKFRSEQAAAKRTAFIASEAQRLGVPQWRVDEGFSITSEMQESDITDYLSKVANNVKANTLPTQKWGIPDFGNGKASKEETDALAEKLLKH